MASTTTPQHRRGPLAHIVDALRLDNRQLLLETLSHDPRLGDIANNEPYHSSSGADSAAGMMHQDAPPEQQSPSNPPPTIVEQQLIFGSADLRRVILRQVMHHSRSNNKKQHKGKKSKNVTRQVEEEEIVKDWNDELKQQCSSGSSSSGIGSGGNQVMQIVGTQILSPSNDGSILSPYQNDNTATSNTASSTPGNNRSFNPFGDDDDDTTNNDVDTTSQNATIITYILRGGGFDLPSLSGAALHRRKVLAQSSRSGGKINSRFLQSPGNPQRKQQIQHQLQQASNEKVFRFVFVPRMTEMERAFLSELGVDDTSISSSSDNIFGSSTTSVHTGGGGRGGASINSLESLAIDLIPLDDDVLSLELTGGSAMSGMNSGMMNESDKSGGIGGGIGGIGSSGSSGNIAPPSAACLRHSTIEGCESDVADIVARSLIKLQLLNRGSSTAHGGDGSGEKQRSLKGAIPRVQGLGPLATAVIDRMMTLRLEEERLEEQQADEEDDEHDEHEDVDMMESGEQHDGLDRDEVVNAVDGVEITTQHRNRAADNTGWEKGDQQQADTNDDEVSTPSIQALMVIDRKIDLVTPMLTPLTYEGLIDDVFQIQVGGCVSIKKSIVEPDDGGDIHGDDSSSSDVLLPLNDSDPLYAEVRDKHVETFGTFLQGQAKALKESHSQFTNRETARDLSEIHQFVKQIPVFTRNLRSLTNHIHIAELVKSSAEATSFRQRWQTERSMLESEPCYEVLEDLIASGLPPYRWLRLFCLQSLTSNGIKATRYDSLRKEVVQTYGYEFLMVLNDLEKAGLLRKRETFFMDSMATPYSTLRKALSAINADVDPSNPEDAAYVSSGYCPMTVRWIQAAMSGYSGLDEALKELPAAGGVGVGSGGGGGRWVDVEQQYPPESLVEAMRRKRAPSLGTLAKELAEDESRARRAKGWRYDGLEEDQKKKPVLLVYFVGGITFMELSSLRFLSRRPSFPYTIICCTTEIVNGGTLLKSLSC